MAADRFVQFASTRPLRWFSPVQSLRFYLISLFHSYPLPPSIKGCKFRGRFLPLSYF
uniref:Uncharacterized protein n=1 Tax=Setaria italica TaxID=4555 RepID=K3YXL7_SETIT